MKLPGTRSAVTFCQLYIFRTHDLTFPLVQFKFQVCVNTDNKNLYPA